MTEAAEIAFLQVLLAFQAVATMIGNRATWDDEEIDIAYPAITLRTLASSFPAQDVASHGGLRRCLVEVACHAEQSGQVSQLVDSVVSALLPLEAGPSKVGAVTFGSVHLQDVTQSPSLRERSYRKAALYAVWFYE